MALRDRLPEGGWRLLVPFGPPMPGDVSTNYPAFADVFDDCTLMGRDSLRLCLLTRGRATVVVRLTSERFIETRNDAWCGGPVSAKWASNSRRKSATTFLERCPLLLELTRTTPPVTDAFPAAACATPVSRPSLSDPRYATQRGRRGHVPAGDRDRRGRARPFCDPEFINDRWPIDLRERTLAAFSHKPSLNRVAVGGRPTAVSRLRDLATTLDDHDASNSCQLDNRQRRT